MTGETNAAVAIDTADLESVLGDQKTVNAGDGDQGVANKEAANDTSENGEQQDDGFVPFPKKAKNAIARRDKEIAKLRAQLRETQQTREAANTNTKPQGQENAPPKEDDFETYGEYLEAKTLHRLRQELAESQKAQHEAKQQETTTAEQQKYLAQRQQDIAVKAQEYAKRIPDFSEVLEDNVDFLDYLPPHVQQVFYEADDAALAFYNLAKEGKLAELAEMSPTKAAMAIARAQNPSALPQKTTQTHSQAPRPMHGASGTGKSAANLANLAKDPDALMKWLNQR